MIEIPDYRSNDWSNNDRGNKTASER
jgi:hypothetical protein